jgi:NAD(P)-dependent dehydrogenase (short-subunit alcohol dehydrogenase family)
MKLSDLKIIVTGGAQGMGAHFAHRLAEAGAQVAVGDVKEDGLAALAEADQGPARQGPRPEARRRRARPTSARSSSGPTAPWAA